MILKQLSCMKVLPQSSFDDPYKASKEELFENWNKTNLNASMDHFHESESLYFPPDRSEIAWRFNFSRKKLQEQLGNNYFVPKLFFFRKRSDNNVFTLTTWTEHIPNVIPPADYFLLTREYKKLWRIIKDTVLISRETLLKNLGSYFDDFDFEACKIIHPEKAAKVKDEFNSIKSELLLKDFAERIAMDGFVNAKPD